MGETGLEPAQGYPYNVLSVACLPIPPLAHSMKYNTILSIKYKDIYLKIYIKIYILTINRIIYNLLFVVE